MGVCAMRWAREVSRGAHDCVGQHTTAPPRRPRRAAGSPTAHDARRGCAAACHPARMSPHALALAPLVIGLLLTASSATAAPSARDPGWVWPVEGPRVVERPFVAPAEPWSAGHRGVDLGAPAAGVPVRAVMAGVVHFAGVVVDRPVVTVRDGQLLATVEPVEPIVVAGDPVAAGQVIGTLLPGHCAAARRAGPCVHLGVRLAGEYVSPLRYLGGLQRAVLLPVAPSGP